MSNQTIGGVPRELLERILSYAWFPSTEVSVFDLRLIDREQLRALLDAPACKACNDTGKMHEPGQDPGSCAACFEEPAAQPQGEPVARVEIGADRDAVMTITDDNWLRSLKARVVHQIVPLYAEQPAPVAVVMPERRDLPPSGPSFYARGWNACLDELKRLNPSL
ncbi:hypothetical protein HX776_24590 [Pseudomonas agarici]|uniref:hypothetical protein n=1 Tax=Pseudomonas agarici TaxID=46677 RepID=UPI000361E253|nr:hypothetical protein [Pseudomonas agarici]NWC11968.1 hypothetical protein [Pseudomonas agarici]SEL92633.1 hypothetical protein SAMN05216604_1651 [Pseudomonas agarici]